MPNKYCSPTFITIFQDKLWIPPPFKKANKAQIKHGVVDKGEKEEKESQEERIKRTREELKGKLEGTTYNGIQNGDITNIPKEALMPEDLSHDKVIKEANELIKLYSPKLRFRVLRGIKRILRR